MFDWVKSCRNKMCGGFYIEEMTQIILSHFCNFCPWIKMNRERVFMPKILIYIHHKKILLDSWSFEFLAINTICYMNFILVIVSFIVWCMYKKYEMVQFNINVLCMHI